MKILEEVLYFSFEYIKKFIDTVEEPYKTLMILGFYVLLILLYGIFTWKFYKLMGSREIIKLNLKKYNKLLNKDSAKFFAVIWFILEYLIILPFLVIFWYAAFSFFIFLLSESLELSEVLLLSTAIIVSARIAAYIKQDLAREIAKAFPFTLLVIFVINPRFLNFSRIYERIINLPNFIDMLLIFLILIFFVEFLLRCFYTVIEYIRSEENE
ncbi:MAG: hypothetical protein QXW97_00330 [Candidatus Pacearchaeota archaeon]